MGNAACCVCQQQQPADDVVLWLCSALEPSCTQCQADGSAIKVAFSMTSLFGKVLPGNCKGHHVGWAASQRHIPLAARSSAFGQHRRLPPIHARVCHSTKGMAYKVCYSSWLGKSQGENSVCSSHCHKGCLSFC